jgi:hypothetical protein
VTRRTRFTYFAAASAAAALACETSTGDKVLVQSQIPGTYTEGRVSQVGERGDYLDANVSTGGIEYRFLFPADDVCRSIVTDGATVRYTQLGPFGRVSSGDQRCDPIGVLSLVPWRNRRGRSAGPVPVPRAQATYEVFYRDADLVFARGRFPLVSQLGISGGRDSVAVFPNLEICQGVLAKSVASMEFRDGGKVVLALVAANGLCPFQGIALPISRADESTGSESPAS